jgi:hypothetical protein
MWHGHLAAVIDGIYLMDTTLDQTNVGHPHLGAKPVVIDFAHNRMVPTASVYRSTVYGADAAVS